MITVNVKRLSEDAVIPSYAKQGDAGMDITATAILSVNGRYVEYSTGLAFEIPEGYVGLIYPRSSLSNYDLILANHVGVIDSGYRGEVKFRFKITNSTASGKFYEKGDKIGQIMIVPYPLVSMREVDKLSESDRGTGGFGSTTKA